MENRRLRQGWGGDENFPDLPVGMDEGDFLPIGLSFLKQADRKGIDEFVRENHGVAVAGVEGFVDGRVV